MNEKGTSNQVEERIGNPSILFSSVAVAVALTLAAKVLFVSSLSLPLSLSLLSSSSRFPLLKK